MSYERVYTYISKHKHHQFTKEFNQTFKILRSYNDLNVQNLRFETLRLIDGYIDSYYYKRNELETKISDLEKQVETLLGKIDQLNDNFMELTTINVNLHKQLMDAQQELSDTINGIIDN